MFFEIGLVLLMPVIYLVARRSQLSLVTVGIPALAGLSAMHGLVPPHPGPLTAIDLLGADLGITLALGVAVAIPTVDCGRSAIRQARRTLGRPRCARPVRCRRLLRQRRRRHRRGRGGRRRHRYCNPDRHPHPAVLRHDHVQRSAAGGADDGQGTRRHFHRRRKQPASPDVRHHRPAFDGPADRSRGRHVHARSGRRHDARSDRQVPRDVLAASRGHHPHRRRRRWVQAGARRHRHRHETRGMGYGGQHLGDSARLGARSAHPARHRFCDGGHHHRVVPDARIWSRG